MFDDLMGHHIGKPCVVHRNGLTYQATLKSWEDERMIRATVEIPPLEPGMIPWVLTVPTTDIELSQ